MRALLAALAVGLALGLLASCSFITATGFNECNADADCGASRVCLQSFCIPLPERCSKAEGAFDQPDRIPLVALLPLTETPDGGAQDDSELMGLNAMKLAVSEANDHEGIKSRRFALFFCNTGRDRGVLVSQLDWFINELHVPAVLTSGSSQTIAAASDPYRVDAGTMIMSATSTSPELITYYQVDHAVWRTAPPDTQQAIIIARLFASDPAYSSARRVTVVYDDSAYGQGLSAAIRQELTAIPAPRGPITTVTIPFTSPTDPASLNASGGLVSKLLLSGPNATVLVAFPPDVSNIVSAAATKFSLTRAGGHRWMLTDAAKDPVILSGPASSELLDSLGTAPAQGAGAGYPNFHDRFFTRYNVSPDTYSFCSHSYDAMYLVMLACAWKWQGTADLPASLLNEGMAHVSTQSATPVWVLGPNNWPGARAPLINGQDINVEGASGKLDYDLDAGAPASPYEVWRITDGGFVTTQVLTP